MKNKAQVKLIVFAAVALILLIVIFSSVYTIPAGYRGVLLTFGKPDMVAQGEGLHFKTPFVQKVIKMQVQTQKYEAELTASSSDLQDVKTKIAINYHISPDSAPEIYRDIGVDYSEKVIFPLEQEANKASTAKYTAEQLITQRDAVRTEMKTLLTERLQPRGIIVEEISIINFAFSDIFTQAIEQKVTSSQLKLKADIDLQRIKIEAEQKVTSAQAEAESLRLQKTQISPELLQLRQIEVQSKSLDVQAKAIEKWNGVLPQIVGTTTPFVNVGNLQTTQAATTPVPAPQ